MSPLSLPTVPADREPLLWLAPAPLWEGADQGEVALELPRLVELATDDFMAAFLDLLSGVDPAGPAGLAALGPADGAGTEDDPLVLYRPVHQRYYLVAGSLVCRRVGLPDRAVDPRGERVSFVVRRLRGTGEEAWLAGPRRWVPATETAVVAGEEQHPVHAAPVGPATDTGPAAQLLGLDRPGLRRVHYGYVPVGGASGTPEPLADPVQALVDDPDRAEADDARILELRLRVAGPWSDLHARSLLPGDVDIAEPSLYLLLDLHDYLARYLPDVLDALVADEELDDGTPAELLRAHLDVDVLADDEPHRLGDALGEVADLLALLHGDPVDEPEVVYDVTPPLVLDPGFVDALGGSGAGSGGLVLAALAASTHPGAAQQVPPELAAMVVARPEDPAGQADRHVLRMVYEHPPCVPVLSKASPVVRFAGTYDADAPARPIRIELPDPAQLRRFNRGVALDMPPALRRMLDAITPKLLKDEAPDPEGGWTLGMICSFSLQIIMLVAFCVMFIFLLLLNIVFWWLPFLKICFPVPMKRSP